MRVSLETIHAFVRASMERLGARAEDARTVADVLVTADRLGIDSHGIQRLSYYVDRIRRGVTDPTASPRTVRESPTTVVIDGGHGLGHVVAAHAMRAAMSKASRAGLGAAAVRNSTHYGIAGYYALMAADRGMVGVATSNARPCQAPTFGVDPMYGTNPLAVAAPGEEGRPFLFDAGMCTIQRGRIELWRRSGETVPDGVVVDAKGRSITDPAEALARFEDGTAALNPLGGAGETLGGHKGFGIAIVLELLNAALQDGAFLTELGGGDADGEDRPYRIGHFFLAMDVGAFTDRNRFRDTVVRMMDALRASRPEPGQARIYVPGDKEWEAVAERERDGVPISASLRAELEALHAELELPPEVRLGG